MGLTLLPEQTAALENHTAGWIAGLKDNGIAWPVYQNKNSYSMLDVNKNGRFPKQKSPTTWLSFFCLNSNDLG